MTGRIQPVGMPNAALRRPPAPHTLWSPPGVPNAQVESGWPRLHPPAVLRVLGISALFVCLVPVLPGEDLSNTFKVASCVSLLSFFVLLPTCIRVNSGNVGAYFPGAPFAILNFVYFVPSSLMPLIFPNAYYGSISFDAFDISLLILALAFLCFDLGILTSGILLRVHRLRRKSFSRISALGAVTVAALVALWSTRVVLARMGFGITHVPSMVIVDSSVSQISVLSESLAYVPLALCLTRICGPAVSAHEVRSWRRWLLCIFVTDALYYLLAGSRLGLLWEVLITVWVLWCRRVRVIPGSVRPFVVLALIGIVPLIYWQRGALDAARPQLGENQLELTREYLRASQGSLLGQNFKAAMDEGIAADAGRLTAAGPFSGVTERVLRGSYPLMWGETLTAEAPLVIPRLIWADKLIGEKIDYIINRNFDLYSSDELSTCEMELLANFGIIGLCLGMLVYGFITDRICAPLHAECAVSEPTLFLILTAMPLVFRVETDIMSIFAGLRLLVLIWVLLRIFEHRWGTRAS
jgi:hypothetical protein